MIGVCLVRLENAVIEHPNSFLVHHCLQAANEGDRQTLRALWAPDLVWHIKGSNPWQGDIKGADNVLEHLAKIGNFGVAGLRTNIEDVMVSNDRASMLCRTSANFGKRVLEADFLVIAEIIDRRIQKITSVPIDADRVAEFWKA
jgi:ketosteroid isomerase-like protein